MIPAINGMGFLQAGADRIVQAASNPTKFLIVAASIQATSAIAGMALQYAGKDLINKEDINVKSSQLAEEIVVSNQELLDRIYATDAIVGNGKNELQEELHREIARGVAKYQRRFHDDKTIFTTNTATEVVGAVPGLAPWANAIGSATKATMGAIKNAEAMGKIEEHTRNAIKKIAKRALGSAAMMQRKLNDEFGKDAGTKLFAELNAQGYVQNEEIDYKNCGKFKEAKLTTGLGDIGKRLFAACGEVADILKPRSHQEFKSKFVSLMSNLVASIQNNEVLGPITGFAGGIVGGEFGLAAEYFYEQVKEHYRESGNAGSKSKFKGRSPFNEEEIVQNTGLNKQRSENTQEEPSKWMPVNSKNTIIVGNTLGVNLDQAIFTFEENGRQYVALRQSYKVFSPDGNTVIGTEFRFEAMEVGGSDGFIHPEYNIEGLNLGIPALGGHKVTGSISIDGTGGFESLQSKTLETIRDALSRAFASSVETGVDSHFDISIKNDANIQFRESVPPIVNTDGMKMPDIFNQLDPLSNAEIPNYSEEGMIGSGLISIEDAQLMKDFLSSEEFKNHMSNVGKGFVTAPKNIALEAKDLAKNIFEYGIQPTEVKILKAFEVIGALSEFNERYTFTEKAKIIGQAAWREIVNSAINPEEQGQFLAEMTAGLGIPRVAKGVKAVGKIVDEVIELGKKNRFVEVLNGEVCPNEVVQFITKIESGIVKAGTDVGSGLKHHFDIDVNLLKKEINFSTDPNNPKLRSKFDKHGGDFEMKGLNFNKENAELFKQNMLKHINDPDTIAIAGEYTRGVGKVIHYYNPKTKLNVMKDINGNFISGWELSEDQQKCLKNIGKIGGYQ